MMEAIRPSETSVFLEKTHGVTYQKKAFYTSDSHIISVITEQTGNTEPGYP
jgi:hypothetical protein